MQMDFTGLRIILSRSVGGGDYFRTEMTRNSPEISVLAEVFSNTCLIFKGVTPVWSYYPGIRAKMTNNKDFVEPKKNILI